MYVFMYACMDGGCMYGCMDVWMYAYIYMGSKPLSIAFCGPSAGIMALFYLLYGPTRGGNLECVQQNICGCTHDFVIKRPGWPWVSSINTS